MDNEAAAQAIYNNSNHAPATASPAPAPLSADDVARKIYDGGKSSPQRDVFAEADRQRQAQERLQADARRGELKSAVAEALKEQPKAAQDQQQQQPKTSEAIQADAA